MAEVQVRGATTPRWPGFSPRAGGALVAGLLAAVLPCGANAQTPPGPAPATPARAGQTVTTQTATTAAKSTAPLLEAVLMTGNSKLPPTRIRAGIAPLIGQPADAALLARVRLAVAAAHDAAGMGLVSVDAPLMQEGVALVRVTALRIGRVDARVYPPTAAEGTVPEPLPAPGLQPAVTAALPALKAGETPDLDAVDRQLRLANLQPHRRWSVDFRAAEDAPAAAPRSAAPPATTSFSSTPGQTLSSERETPTAVAPARTLPGARNAARLGQQIDARVVVSGEDSIYGRVMLDNAGQASTGRERARLQLGHGDLFGPGRSLDATVLVSASHPDRQQQVALRYQHPLPEMATLLAVEVSKARSKPGIVSQFFDVSGNSHSFNVSARHLLARSGALEPYAEIALESSVHDDVVDFFGLNLGSKVGVAPVVLSLGATWQGAPWSVFGQARLKHNFGWGPHASDANYAGARFGATPDWTTLDAAAEARRSMGNGQEFVTRAQMQWSRDALVSPQQFRAGGQTLLRGLRESELGGDKGIALAFEYWWAVAASHRLGALIDTAEVRRNKRLAGEPESAGATSVGIGWNWQVVPGVRLSTTAAHIVSARNLPQSKSGDSRLHVLLDWSF